MMSRRKLLLGAGAFVVLAIALFWPKGQTPDAPPKVVAMSRVIRLPAQFSGAAVEKLTLTPGAEDEEPQGPDSFDVLSDGSLVLDFVRYELGQL